MPITACSLPDWARVIGSISPSTKPTSCCLWVSTWVEYQPRLWNPNADKCIVHADFLPAEVDEHYCPQVELVGDLAHMLWMLNERVDAAGGLSFDLSSQRSLRREMWGDIMEHADDDTQGSVRPQKALADSRAVLGPEDVCYPMSAPTRCGSRATITATRRIHA